MLVCVTAGYVKVTSELARYMHNAQYTITTLAPGYRGYSSYCGLHGGYVRVTITSCMHACIMLCIQ